MAAAFGEWGGEKETIKNYTISQLSHMYQESDRIHEAKDICNSFRVKNRVRHSQCITSKKKPAQTIDTSARDTDNKQAPDPCKWGKTPQKHSSGLSGGRPTDERVQCTTLDKSSFSLILSFPPVHPSF